MNVQGSTAIVTGANRGLGKAIVSELLGAVPSGNLPLIGAVLGGAGGSGSSLPALGNLLTGVPASGLLPVGNVLSTVPVGSLPVVSKLLAGLPV